MNKYTELKDKITKEVNDFLSNHAFFAFDDKQFEEGMSKLNMTNDNLKDKIVRLPGGGFIRKDKVNDYKQMSQTHDQQLEEAMKDEEFAVSAFDYELGNHEWAITLDPTDAVNALGYTEKDIQESEYLANCLAKALQSQREYAIKHTW